MNLFLASAIDGSVDLLIREHMLDPLKTPTVYIPTAENCFNPPRKLEERGSYQCLIQRRFPVTVCELDKESGGTIRQKLSQTKIIVIGGGNTYFLLYHMRRSGFAEMLPALFAKGIIYVGSSAGSCVCSPDVGYVKDQDDPILAPKLSNLNGLNLVELEIYPHCIEPYYAQSYTHEYVYGALQSPAKKIFLRDHQAIVVKDTMYKIV